MIIFGIESSCDDTAAAVIDVKYGKATNEYRLLSSVVSSQTAVHALYGGVVPEIASRAHAENISVVVKEALRRANITFSDIEAVAVTFAPGLIGSLLVGVSYAKSLALALGVPLIPVNHIEAHASAAYLEYPELSDSFLALVVSGGHTSFYDVCNHSFTEIGASRDDAAGEAFDKVGRVMGLPYPAGAEMDRLATSGYCREEYKNIKLPSPAMTDGTLEFSFSGLKTAAVNYIHATVQRLRLTDGAQLHERTKEDIATAFTDVTVKAICAKLSDAVKQTGASQVVLAGGVAANSHLRSAAQKACRALNVSLCVPSLSLCGDNGAMTAAAGAISYSLGITADSSLNAFASDEAAEEFMNTLKSKTHAKTI